MAKSLALEPDKTQPSVTTRRNTFIFLFLLGLVLYLGLHLTNYDGNDIIEMKAVYAADNSLFSPNHLAYRPLVWVVTQVFQGLGYTGGEILPAHLIVSVSGALAVALFYLWMTKLVKSNAVAAITAFAFGTSWAFWVYSINLMYFVPGILAITAALNLMWMIWNRPKDVTARQLEIGLGVLTAAAILFWQAHIFFIPLALFALWLKYRNSREFLRSSLAYLVPVMSIVGVAYMGASVIVTRGNWSVSALLDWVFNYGSARLETWGVLDPARVLQIPHGQLASILPFWEGLGLRDLLSGQIHPDKILAQLALVALILMVTVPIVVSLWRRTWSREKLILVGLLTVGYVVYLPFIIWWDPTEPLWFAVLNIALWAIIGILWDSISTMRYAIVGYGVMAVTLALGNFSTAIWPRHTTPNPLILIADCIAENTEMNDLVVTIGWGWSEYVIYFHQQPTFDLIDWSARSEGPEQAITQLGIEAPAVREQVGEVFIQDSSQFIPEYYQWLRNNTGLTPERMATLQGELAFTCYDINFNYLADPIANPTGN